MCMRITCKTLWLHILVAYTSKYNVNFCDVCMLQSKYANTKWQETSPTQHTTLSFATHNYVRKMYNMLRKEL